MARVPLVDSTASNSHGPVTRGAEGHCAQLFFLLDAERPLVPPARYLLDVESVRFGRSSDRSARRGVAAGERVLWLAFPDRWASVAHAQLRRVLGRWVLEDLQSKNGTLVNGAPIDRVELKDGDLIEAGHSFFRFRASLPAEGPLAPEEGALPGLATVDPLLAATLQQARAIAASKVPVVLVGETGTGKEVLAATIHRLSGRTGPFVAVNCGALPAHLVESELFGYRKGAFSGATEDRKGLVRAADGGTLFLDEIGDLPAPAQAAILRVLQESEVPPLGSTQPVKVDFRLLVATHRELPAMVAQQTFRADLLARLSGFVLRLPPLRERLEDLGLLIAALLVRLQGARAGSVRFSPDAARALLQHRWPLNVRELEKCLSAAMVLAGDGPVEAQHLPAAVLASVLASAQWEEPLDEADTQRREELIALLRQHRGNVTAVATAMGKARMQIQRWIKRYRIDLPGLRK